MAKNLPERTFLAWNLIKNYIQISPLDIRRESLHNHYLPRRHNIENIKTSQPPQTIEKPNKKTQRKLKNQRHEAELTLRYPQRAKRLKEIEERKKRRKANKKQKKEQKRSLKNKFIRRKQLISELTSNQPRPVIDEKPNWIEKQLVRRKGWKKIPAEDPDIQLTGIWKWLKDSKQTRRNVLRWSIITAEAVLGFSIAHFGDTNPAITEIISVLNDEFINNILGIETSEAEIRNAIYTSAQINNLILVDTGDSWALGKEDDVSHSEDIFHPVSLFVQNLLNKFQVNSKVTSFNIAQIGQPLNAVISQLSQALPEIEKSDLPIDLIESGGGNNVDAALKNVSSYDHLVQDLRNPWQTDTLRLINHADEFVAAVQTIERQNLEDILEMNKNGEIKHIWTLGIIPVELTKGIVAEVSKRVAAEGFTVIPQPNDNLWKFLERILSLAIQKRKKAAITEFEQAHPDANFTIHFIDIYKILSQNYTKQNPTLYYEHGTEKGYMDTAYYILERMIIDGKPLNEYLKQQVLIKYPNLAERQAEEIITQEFNKLLAGTAADLDPSYFANLSTK